MVTNGCQKLTVDGTETDKYIIMFLSLLTLFVALTLSVIAAYYSIAGLAAIFAAAVIPIIIMGSVLEAAKIVVTLWLHEYWKQCRLLMKLYLVPAVLLLMLITSMGIFGFLSKAHTGQTSASIENVAQVQRLTSELARQTDVVTRAEEKIKQLESSGTGADAQTQSQIDREVERINSAYKRIQPAIDEQNKIIASQGGIYKSELDKIDTALAQLQSYIDKNEIAKAQAMVGAKADGQFGPNTATKFKTWQTEKQEQRVALIRKIELTSGGTQAKAASAEIKRLRSSVEVQIAESNKLINRLRLEVGKTKTVNIDVLVDEQNVRIKTANAEIEKLTKEKFAIEGEYRKLEAEVGPIKYIAAFIYGDNPDSNVLERAVRWVIILLVCVFDPLAIMMLLAATESLAWIRKNKKIPSISVEPKYEQDDGPLTEEQIEQIVETAASTSTSFIPPASWGTTPIQHHPDTHPYLKEGFKGAKQLKPIVAPHEPDVKKKLK
jgi:hypothetical protein